MENNNWVLEGRRTRAEREALDRLYENREDADLVIACRTKIFKVHGEVVRGSSEYFRAAFFGGFKEQGAKRLEVDEDPFLFTRLVRYLYTINYPDNQIVERPEGYDPRAGLVAGENPYNDPDHSIMAASDEVGTETSWTSRANTNAQMYRLGDIYQLPHLRQTAVLKVQYACSLSQTHMDTLFGLRLEAELLAVVPLVYGSTPDTDRGLRALLLAHVAANWNRLSVDDAFQDVIAETPRFAIDLVNSIRPTTLYKGTCRRCATKDTFTALRVRCVCGESETVLGSRGP